jgi:hypothetical protein
MDRCIGVIQSVARCGGALTINWHTRSLSPERLWGEFYKALLARIKQRKVWFCTAGANAKWFRARRAVRFEAVSNEEELRLTTDGPLPDDLPPLKVRIYRTQKADHRDTDNQDLEWRGGADLAVCVAPQSRI